MKTNENIEKTNEQLIDFNLVPEQSQSEKIIKQWIFEEANESELKINKVTLTDERLILSQNKNNLEYRKFSYDLEDIRSVNYKVSQEQVKTKSIAMYLLIAAALLFFSIGSFVYETIAVGCILMVISILVIFVGIYINGKSKECFRKIIVTIEKIDNTRSVDIIESSSLKLSMPINGKKVVFDELSFNPTKESIEMVLEIDKLILDVKNKLKNNKSNKNNKNKEKDK